MRRCNFRRRKVLIMLGGLALDHTAKAKPQDKPPGEVMTPDDQSPARPQPTDIGKTYWRSAPALTQPLGPITPETVDDATFRLLADCIPTLCWIANGDGYIVWYNRRWHEYCGTTPDQMQGWGWQSVHDPALLPEVMSRWTASIATGEPFEMTFPLRGADGRFRPFMTRIQPVRDVTGAVVRWFGVNADISEQRAAEDALRQSNETLLARVRERTQERDATWNNTRDLLIISDPASYIWAVNPAWTSTLGWTEEELVGRSIPEFLHPEDRETSKASRDAVQEAAGRWAVPSFQTRFRHKNGSYRWFEWVASAEAGRLYSSGRDITTEKDAAAALALAEEQLRQSQKMEAIGQLTGGIAHDFNNLLTGILGSLELIQARVGQGRIDDVARYTTAARDAAQRAAALTHRLLAFSRRQTLDPRPTDIPALIAGLEDLIRRTVGAGIHLEVQAAADTGTVRVDPTQLENVLLNLCINARDAMPTGGVLTIETQNQHLEATAAAERGLPPGRYVALAVADTGCGMTPEVKARAFDPFFTTKPLGKGTGLGLSMAYGFARQSGGDLAIDTRAGQGTRLSLLLPHYVGGSAAQDASAAAHPCPPPGGAALLVDDEPAVRELIAEALEGCGWTVHQAADGHTGIRTAMEDRQIDLLITDVGLPGTMNGRMVADAIQSIRPGLKVLFITGYTEGAVIDGNAPDPSRQMLTKPFTIEAFLTRVSSLVAELEQTITLQAADAPR
jgi:PAS domain S-box-containing protein